VAKNYPTPHSHLCHHGGVSLNASLRRQKIGKQLGLDMVVVIDNCKDDKTRKEQLNPDWVEWLMGFPRGWTSLEVLDDMNRVEWVTDPADNGECPRVTSGTVNRVARLKALGNAQVPDCMALSWLIFACDIAHF
jgi:hypothetical protein